MAGIFSAIEISASGMTVQRKKMDAVAQNIANVDTARTPEGTPYRRRRVIVSEGNSGSSFQASMTRAHNKLFKTHANHISGVARSLSNGPALSPASAEEVIDPASGFRQVYDPSHPEANDEGYVELPDIEIINEMVDMIAANRAYEANIAVVTSSKRMINETLDI